MYVCVYDLNVDQLRTTITFLEPCAISLQVLSLAAAIVVVILILRIIPFRPNILVLGFGWLNLL